MKKIGMFTAAVFFCCLSVGLATDVISTKTHSLDNGLTVLVSEMPASSTVSLYGLVKAGSATEGKYLGAGLSHFMEHMLFKGTERRGPGDIPNEIQSLGGTINASTGLDYTIYTITVPKEKAGQAADILSDMLFNAKFDPQELKREREVVFNEIRLYRDRPERYLSELVFSTAYQVHPYRIPVIGFKELLAPLTREDFLDYYHSRYVPNNILISFAGGIDSATALELANQYFGRYSRGQYALQPLPVEPRQRVFRFREEYYSTQLIQGSLSYQGVDVNDEDMVALDALAMILGQGRGSRLFQALVERRKVVHSITASNFTPKDPGLFEIEFSLEEGDVDQVVSLIEKQIKEIQEKGVTEAELEKVVNSSLKDLFLNQETSWG
ncbi:MAG TPA: pitrilysin family protein, partial [Candidatus Bathyarchaeia archaeon]|nr:pitrilysin family protein [Candidatus Bathyarchaeia archaeon]